MCVASGELYQHSVFVGAFYSVYYSLRECLVKSVLLSAAKLSLVDRKVVQVVGS